MAPPVEISSDAAEEEEAENDVINDSSNILTIRR
jgi:hypothetical protein